MALLKKLSFFGLLLVAGCSKEKPRVNRSNSILVSTVIDGRRIDEYLIDNGMNGTVDLCLRCERDNYSNSFAFLSQYAFYKVREIQGNSKLAYEIKHPEDGRTIQIFAETKIIDSLMQAELDKKYWANNK